MERRHKDALRRCRVSLVQGLQPDVVSHYLVERGLLTEGEEEELRQFKTAQEKNELILSCIPRKGKNAFDKFVTLLESFESQRSLAEDLKRAEQTQTTPVRDGRHRSTRTAPEAATPKQSSFVMQESMDSKNTWAPPAAASSSSVSSSSSSSGMVGFAGAPVPAGSSSIMVCTVDLDDASKVYPMIHRPRGLSIVINIKNFHRKCRMNKRNGTDKDATTLDTLWTELGFQNKVYHDVSAPDIDQHFRELAQTDHSAYDCLVVSVLTHGSDHGRIYTSDGEIVSLNKLLTYFHADRAHRSLVGKPKLFFIQACRGDDFDKGTDVPDSGTADIARFLSQDVVDGADFQALPAQADMLIAYATTPGYVSWRNSEHGSWFINAIDEVFHASAYKEDLVTMMIEVNKVVARDFEASGNHRQMPSPVVQLLRKLYFRPAYYVN